MGLVNKTFKNGEKKSTKPIFELKMKRKFFKSLEKRRKIIILANV